MRLVRKVLFGWVYYLLNRPGERVWVRFFGGCLMLAGTASLVGFGVTLPQRLAVPEHARTTIGYPGACDNFYGGSYAIRVRGTPYQCTGADGWCATEPSVQVVYNDKKPQQCRRADRVDKLSGWEWYMLGADTGLVSFGLALLLIHERDDNRPRFIISHSLLLLAMALVIMLWPLSESATRLP